jgi:hypothetical protein
MNLFDDFAENDNYDSDENEKDVDRDVIEKILKKAKIKFTETSDGDFDDILRLKNGIGIVFDNYGSLLCIVKELKDE